MALERSSVFPTRRRRCTTCGSRHRSRRRLGAEFAPLPSRGRRASSFSLPVCATARRQAGFACHSYWLATQTAAQVPTWQEEFNDPTPPTLFGFQPPGVDMSNAHSAELAYLWNFTLGERPLTPNELRLGRQMDRYWAAFARNANPNVPQQTHWPQVTTTNHPVLDLRPTGNTVSTTAFPTEHQCSFWATIEPTS